MVIVLHVRLLTRQQCRWVNLICTESTEISQPENKLCVCVVKVKVKGLACFIVRKRTPTASAIHAGDDPVGKQEDEAVRAVSL